MTVDAPTTRPVGPSSVLPTGTGRLEPASLGPFELDDGTVLPELTVAYRHDGPAPGQAPQVVVVHARQVVVDQRVDVDAFHREPDAQRAVAVDVEQRAGRRHEQRTHPLAPADRGVAHRLVQAAAAVVEQAITRG